jgi:hypothetical protein
MRAHRFTALLALGSAALLACDHPAEPRPAEALASSRGIAASVTGAGHITREDGSKRHFTISATRRADGA